MGLHLYRKRRRQRLEAEGTKDQTNSKEPASAEGIATSEEQTLVEGEESQASEGGKKRGKKA